MTAVGDGRNPGEERTGDEVTGESGGPDGDVRLVRLGQDDAGEVLTLQRAAYVTQARLHQDWELPPLTQTLAGVRADLADPGVVGLGLRCGHRLVAAVRIRPDGAGNAVLERLTVVPDRQGTGLGTRLLRAAEDAVPDDVARMVLFTGGRSEANLRLYRRHGYRETHRTPAGGYDLVHLAKDLRRNTHGERSGGGRCHGREEGRAG